LLALGWMIVLPLGGIPPPAKPITQSHHKANLPPAEFHIKPLVVRGWDLPEPISCIRPGVRKH
jgi:hypothetical protein